MRLMLFFLERLGAEPLGQLFQALRRLIEQLRQMGDELNASRQQAADIQSQLDSLRGVVARQDTLLTRIAGMAGIQR